MLHPYCVLDYFTTQNLRVSSWWH